VIETSDTESDSRLRRRIRLLVIVDAAERALIAPLSVSSLHLMAYLSNVLAPVWDVPVLDGRLLKKESGPYYPVLQSDADHLVGQGLLILSNLNYSLDLDHQWRLRGSYVLNHSLCDEILESINLFPDERAVRELCNEIALSLSTVEPGIVSALNTQDATYGDAGTDPGNVVDFAEWKRINFAANAALTLGSLLRDDGQTSAGEMIHSYVSHVARRLYANQ
jgi:hypothetical protein